MKKSKIKPKKNPEYHREYMRIYMRKYRKIHPKPKCTKTKERMELLMQRILDLYSQGLTQVRIADSLNTSKPTVCRYLKKHRNSKESL